ncbi:hypothetical protein [Vibrio natriegens]|uniref:hypothetical protein n=1 Tax=Vibrio natriegens TaxID=691 RepID=UPI001FBAC204|nr:hypothetical protein [Vibrio natriegens]
MVAAEIYTRLFMERVLLTPHEFAKTVFESGHKGLTSVYPDMLYSAEQQLKLIQFVVETGEIRQVVKIEKEFSAVEGHCTDNDNIEADSIIRLPAGDYVTDSKVLIGRGSHRYVYGLDEVAYTVVNDTPRTDFREGFGFKPRIVMGEIIRDKLNLYDVLLFCRDAERYLAKLKAESSTNSFCFPMGPSTGIDRKGTLDDLIEVTGTSNSEDAIGVAIWHVEQAELENQRQDKSPVFAQFKSVLSQCENGALRFKTLTQVENYLMDNHGFNTRQANVFGQEIIKQMPDL